MRFTRAKSRRCSRSASIPLVSLPNAEFTREALEKLEFFAVTDFFLSETARYADVVLAGSLQEEEEGVTCSAEGRVIHIQRAVDPPANARRDSEIICDLARRLGKEKFFPFETPREIFEELREASRGGHADYYGITYEKIDAQMGVFWPCPTLDHPGTPHLMQGGVSFFPDGKCRFQLAEWRESGDPVDEIFPTISDHGARGQSISLGHADPADRRAGRHLSGATCRDSSAYGGAARNHGQGSG